jgi:hypothetical protein
VRYPLPPKKLSQEKSDAGANEMLMNSETIDSALSVDLPWCSEGLFSAHYLTHRLPEPKSAICPSEAESDAVFAQL